MFKRPSLVCQFLENISREALEEYQGIIRRYIRGRQGIYALYRGSRLYYVGLTTDLRFRLRQHLADRHGQLWDRFSVYLTLGNTPLKELESLILRIGTPGGNKQHGKFVNADNLLSKFSREIRSLQRTKHDLIIGRNRLHSHGNEAILQGRKLFPLSEYTDQVAALRAKFKGKVIKARVRKDGTIRLGAKVYETPSLAAAVACKRPTCNGWIFWLYERAPGDWVRLDCLRRQ